MEFSMDRVPRIVNDLASHGRRAYYGRVAEEAGGSRRNRGHLNNVTRALMTMTAEDLAAGRPVRAVAVINSRTGVPGERLFAEMLAHGRRLTGSWTTIVNRELRRCAQHYGRKGR